MHAASVTNRDLETWDTISVGNGEYTLQLVVTDTVGYVSTGGVVITC